MSPKPVKLNSIASWINKLADVDTSKCSKENIEPLLSQQLAALGEVLDKTYNKKDSRMKTLKDLKCSDGFKNIKDIG